jgi:hypothetical protein
MLGSVIKYPGSAILVHGVFFLLLAGHKNRTLSIFNFNCLVLFVIHQDIIRLLCTEPVAVFLSLYITGKL